MVSTGFQASIKSLRDNLLAHYEANRGSGRTFCEVVESSSLVIEINLVLVRLERLGIAIPDRSRFSDEDEAGKMWWIAYLTALERLSGWQHLGRRNYKSLYDSM